MAIATVTLEGTLQHSVAPSYAQYRGRKYFDVLDGIRALCILLVVFSHLEPRLPVNHEHWQWVSGFVGVYGFFVLSGYLITTLSLREEDARGSLSLKGFYLRRIFRICPLYFLVIAIYCLLSFGLPKENHAAEMATGLPYFLTYMNEFAPVPIFQQGWSLGVEEKFYLLWPLLGFVLWRKNTKARLAGTVVLILLPVAVSYLISLRAPSFAVVWVAGYGMIMTGCLLAQSLHIRGSFERLRFLARPAWARSAVLLLLTFYVVTAWFPKKSTPQAATVAFFFAIAVAIFLIPTLITRTPWTGFLESRVLVFIGRRSYAIYLVHMLAVNIAVRVAPRFQSDLLTSIVWLTAAFGFSILVSDLLHRAVERPMIAFGRSLTGARSPAVAGVS